ncbi:MAG: hypothetical protein KA004_10775 [Verrucomicrobiales bacterium]|nr:hypothetical protein [Verrucomicrobiales bacterium]
MKPILLTSFKPFAGRGINGSSTVLCWLRRHLPAGTAQTRILPVTWEQAPRFLQNCLQRGRPRWFLGLGEGKSGQVAWETLARNRMEGTDEIGCEGPAGSICPQSPDSLASTLQLRSPSSWALPVPLVRSSDAGTFLCNRILWEVLRHFPATQSAFLHLPPQGNMRSADYARTFGPFVFEILRDLSGF